MDRAGQRFRHRAHIKRNLLFQQKTLRIRHYRVFRKTAVHIHAQSKQVLTILLFSHAARSACSAVDVGVQRHMISDGNTRYRFSCFHHDPGVFVTKDHRRHHLRRALLPVINMYICSADSRGHVFHQHLVRLQRRKIHFAHFKFLRLIGPDKKCSLHFPVSLPYFIIYFYKNLFYNSTIS